MNRFCYYVIIYMCYVFVSEKSFGQNDSEKFLLQFSGYVKTDIYYDSRQMETLREGHISLYPKAPMPDTEGKDINSAPSLNIQAIQSRFRTDFKTPSVLNAKVSGAIEAEFFGVSNSDVNGVRLRHAYGKMSWDHSELLIGQFWHPFFVTECFANTQAFNTGIPFQPFARNPQVRFTYRYSKLKLIGAILSERDYPSIGPKGASNEYQRNSGIPMSNFQIQFGADSGLFIGAGIEYKQIKPELSTSSNYSASNKVNAVSGLFFIKYEASSFYWRVYAALLENSYDLVGIGGYAVTSIDPVTNISSYTPLRSANIWNDIQLKFNNFQFGLFSGYLKNLGADRNILSDLIFSRDKNIDKLYRISPRFVFRQNKVSFGFEPEYTIAFFGLPGMEGKVQNSKNVSNLRMLFTAFYFF